MCYETFCASGVRRFSHLHFHLQPLRLNWGLHRRGSSIALPMPRSDSVVKGVQLLRPIVKETLGIGYGSGGELEKSVKKCCSYVWSRLSPQQQTTALETDAFPDDVASLIQRCWDDPARTAVPRAVDPVVAEAPVVVVAPVAAAPVVEPPTKKPRCEATLVFESWFKDNLASVTSKFKASPMYQQADGEARKSAKKQFLGQRM